MNLAAGTQSTLLLTALLFLLNQIFPVISLFENSTARLHNNIYSVLQVYNFYKYFIMIALYKQDFKFTILIILLINTSFQTLLLE